MDASRIGPFALEEKLGGKESSVYHAVHVQQRRQAAIKLFSIALAPNDASRNEFSDEMNLLKRLQHKHIARCFGGSTEKNLGYIACELLSGETLAALLARRQRLPWEQTMEYALQICAALEFAHANELTHQDLQPDKIFITEEGVLKVLDFRRERRINPFCVSSQRRTLTRVRYQSPEQIRGEPASAKSDLYALGCICYEMLTGAPPFTGQDLQSIVQGQLNSPPVRVAAVALDCPVWLDALVSQLLEKDPARRPYGAAAVRLALEETQRRVASGSGVAQHAIGGLSPLKMRGNREEVNRILGRKPPRVVNQTPLQERPWFIAVCLSLALVMLAIPIVVALWPVSEEKLFAQAEALMSTNDFSKWEEARGAYLERLQTQFPQGKYAARVQEYLDAIEMHRLENRLKTKARLGQPALTGAERLYVDALRFEQFGDPTTALERYRKLCDTVALDGEDRPFVLLAQRQIAKLKEAAGDSPQVRQKFIHSKLAQADALHDKGQTPEARVVWRTITSLYGEVADLAPLVAQAQSRLEQSSGDAAARSAADPPPKKTPPAQPKKSGS